MFAVHGRAYLSVDDAADRTGLSTKTIRRMIDRGELAARKVARRILIPVSALDPDQLGQPANRWAEGVNR